MVRRRNIKTVIWWGLLTLTVLLVFHQILPSITLTQNYKKNVFTEQYGKISRCAGLQEKPPSADTSTEDEASYNTTKTVPLPYEAIQDQYFKIKHREALLFGKFRNTTGYLTIAIPTVKRNKVSYLEPTLDSLIRQTSQKDRRQIVVVVFFADQDHKWVIEKAKSIHEKYNNLTEEGFIQLVHPHHNSYPDFTRLERKFNDSVERVSWRSKQNLDYAYLATYCQNISKYYMQIEDDVITATNYFNQIRQAVERRKPESWFVLNFSRLGFIGKLFKSTDLSMLADFLLMFFAEKPGDILLNDLRIIKGQLKDIGIRPSLFQHIGVLSSLTNKTQMLVDKGFRDKSFNHKRFFHHNPDASIHSNMETYEKYIPRYAYDTSPNVFWSKDQVPGNYYNISFNTPQNIFRVYIKTGNTKHKKDILDNGVIKLSTQTVDPKGSCTDMKEIAEFTKGVADLNSPETVFPPNITCISIVVTKAQEHWLIISEISIFNS